MVSNLTSYARKRRTRLLIVKTIFYGIGAVPFTFSASLLAFYCHVAWRVDHLPTYGNPDPKYTNGLYGIYAPWVENTLLLSFGSVVVWLAFLIVYLVVVRKQLRTFAFKWNAWWVPIAIGLFWYGLAGWLIESEVFNWFLD